MTIRILGFDADDTLWHNETIFHLSEQRFMDLLAGHAATEDLAARLVATERRNLKLYGYGIKGFTLSMVETALAVSDADLPVAVIAEILAIGRDMLQHPVEPLPGVVETLRALRGAGHPMVLITKGDLLDQEQKVARSGLAELFETVEIVSEKTAATYRRIFGRWGAGEGEAVMIGNSAASDVLPAIQAGFWGLHIPYEITWVHERAEIPDDLPRHRRLASITEVPAALAAILAG
ncbi:HAD family hydrolase [Siculibacillus lacustris]|uniref:HAD family hydrolase n=1 Tax=Siculibacillus lacustris TaxID=1549641 RepID=A0A4Q9VY85_9HYPH|nr:HAD family hydrolase [Siculibacillus lacustris]TBW40945.1 HAD family hydrolase [Siculibacillus lacustris]